jgi:4-amino-4-deoxy-L-arabinose transferase-like glycosyltransferase
MLFASLLIYLAFSIFLYPRIFEKITFPKFVLVINLCIFSINVLTCECLSLLHLLNHPWIFLGIQTLFCIMISLVIQRYYPLTKQAFPSVFDFSNFHFTRFQLILVSLISATFIGFFVVGITTPINNSDSLATHLPRIYYWLQQGSLDYWTPLTALYRYQLVIPFNAHLQGLCLFLLSHNENLFFLVQWFSLIVTTVSIYEISKTLGFSTTKSLVSSIIGLSFPVVLLQAFSFQGDLTVTAFVMVFIVFALYYHQTKSLKFFWLAVFSIVLALGIKQTAFFILPVACLVALFLLLHHKSFSKFFKYSWLVIILVMLFSSYQYILNIIHTGSVFGLESVLNEKYTSLTQATNKASYLVPRFTYQFVGVDGLPRSLQPSVIQIKENLFKGILNPIGLDLEREVYLQAGFDKAESFQYNVVPELSEDTAWFGPLAFLLIPLAAILSFFSKDKKRRRYAFICIINSILYLTLIVLQRPGWDPYQGRYFIMSLSPFVPMISMLFPDSKILRRVIIGVLVLISTVLILNTLLINDTKPIITARTQNDIINHYISPLPEQNDFQVFIKKSLLKIAYPTKYSSKLVNIYEATYYDRLFYSNIYSAKDIQLVNLVVPEGQPISILIFRSPLEFALFGKNCSRIVIPVKDTSKAEPGYLLISNGMNIQPFSELRLLGKNDNYSIYNISAK